MEEVIMTLAKTDNRPEEMRVVKDSNFNWYLVQAKSDVVGNWITQAEYRNEKTAIMDCSSWY